MSRGNKHCDFFSFMYNLCNAQWEYRIQVNPHKVLRILLELKVQYKCEFPKTKGGADSPKSPITFGQPRISFKGTKWQWYSETQTTMNSIESFSLMYFLYLLIIVLRRMKKEEKGMAEQTEHTLSACWVTSVVSWLLAAPWTVYHQAALSLRLSAKEHRWVTISSSINPSLLISKPKGKWHWYNVCLSKSELKSWVSFVQHFYSSDVSISKI